MHLETVTTWTTNRFTPGAFTIPAYKWHWMVRSQSSKQLFSAQ